MIDLLEGLNEAQREAVTSTEGYVRVIAGAGSGKTRALSRRFAFLVNELGILPGNILCVTFTNKSAQEMRQRIHNLTGDQDTGYINTFHGFCVSVLQEDIHELQYPKSFLVLDNADIDEMLKIIYAERGLTLRDMTYSQARDMFEIRKTITETDYYEGLITMSLDGLKQRYDEAVKSADILFYGYLYQQKKCFGLDYNDLINFVLYLFRTSPETRQKWQERLEYIMIDEFQDIDGLQYRLMEALCGYHRNLFLVGDPDQTIYTWRGANVRYLLNFDQEYPNVRTVLMNENYRSTPQILAASNALIAVNRERIPKDLVPTVPDGAPVLCHLADTTEEEAVWIVSRMQEQHRSGVPYRDMTLLYRAHYVTRAVEEALRRAEIPYHIYSGVEFFQRMEIRDALAYLRLLCYRDDLSFRRVINVPKRNIGERRMKFLEEVAEREGGTLFQALEQSLEEPLFQGTGAREFLALVEHLTPSVPEWPISELLSALLEESGYERMLRTEGSQERLDNLAELKQSIYEYETTCGEETTLESYLSHLALFAGGDGADPGDKVKLMTVHAAKGLEFPHVFLCGMNEGIFPSRKVRTRQGMEEERRLAFVAMTRAQKSLTLTGGGGWNFDGSTRYPSRFLLDIGPEHLQFAEPPSEQLIAATREHIARTESYLSDGEDVSVFSEGDRVRHAVFGEGTVEEVDWKHSFYRISFDGLATPRRITFRVKLDPCQ